jgi:predicted Rdx family selenoprotein
MRQFFLFLITVVILPLFNSSFASSHCGFFDPDCQDLQSLNPKMIVKHYNPDLAFNGTTMFGLEKKTGEKAIIEVDMQGNIVWEYVLPSDVAGGKKNSMVGADVEYLPNGNILFQVRGGWDKKGNRKSVGTGNFEITRNGKIVWSYKDAGASHDIDRLENGNTIWTRGWAEKGEPHVIEVNPAGEVVWQWNGMEEFDVEPFSEVFREGWMHANAVTRLENGNTLISLRNFDMVVEVDKDGKTIWSQKFLCEVRGLWKARGMEEGLYSDSGDDYPLGCNPHEPEIQPNGNMLVTTRKPFTTYELTRDGEVVWEANHRDVGFTSPRSRDVDRLPNGNTLIQVDSVLYEVTPDKQIVWILDFPEINKFSPGKAKRKYRDEPKSFWKQFKFNGLYKAQRIAPK